MVNQQLLDYVRQQLAAGVAKPSLIQALAGQGWNAQDISEAFAAIEGAHPIPAPTPAPIPTPSSVQPSVMQPIAVAVGGEKHTSGAGKRLFTSIIDTIVISLIYIGTTLLLPHSVAVYVPSIVLSLLISFLYYVILESSSGRTLGKLIVGTKVVRLDGTKPHLMQTMGRTLCRYIPLEAFTFLMGTYAYGWHDRFSGTMVVSHTYSVAEAASINPKQRGKTTAGHIALIVILILIIPGSIVSAIFLKALATARTAADEVQVRDAERNLDLHEIQLSLGLYQIQNSTYPSSLDALVPAYNLASVPTDPLSHIPYEYEPNATLTSYTLCATLESNSQPECLQGSVSSASVSTSTASTQ